MQTQLRNTWPHAPLPSPGAAHEELLGYRYTAALIRQNEVGRRRTPIIALTGSTLNQESNRHLAASMDDFLEKPINPQLFYEMISKWTAQPLETAPAVKS